MSVCAAVGVVGCFGKVELLRISQRNLDIGVPNFVEPEIRIGQTGFFQPQFGTGAALNYDLTISPTLLVNFRYGFSRTLLDFAPRSDGYDPTQLGLPSYISANADRIYFPGVALAGYLGLGQTGSARRVCIRIV